jgi:acetyl esterase
MVTMQKNDAHDSLGWHEKVRTVTGRRLRSRARKRVGARLVDAGFTSLAHLGRFHPDARLRHHGVKRIANLPYKSSGDPLHRLDIYRPTFGHDPHPVVFYVHGGAFRSLSKDTHWVMALTLARRGYVVVNINYRLAPRHRFPLGLQDVMDAYLWTLDNIAFYGGNPDHMVLAGESAGANLVTSLTLASTYQRPESWAARVFERNHPLKAVLAACGVYQVSNGMRYFQDVKSRFLRDRLTEMSEDYLPRSAPHGPGGIDLADPVVVLERGEVPERPLPPFFLPVGTKDPLIADTRRLAQALTSLGGRAEPRYYAGEGHAFHAVILRETARQCWRDTFEFLNRVAPVQKP